MAEVTAAVARSDMSQAFSIWCHRMGIEYLPQADPTSRLRDTLLPQLGTAEVLGSTSFASASGELPRPGALAGDVST